MKERYVREKNLWFPRTDTPEHAAYDKRKAGLLHVEKTGRSMVSLCSKTYYVEGEDGKPKFSSKGIQQRGNNITKDTYHDVLKNKVSGSGTNKDFRLKVSSVHTYIQQKCGFSYFYPKRKVLKDGVSTRPLDI